METATSSFPYCFGDLWVRHSSLNKWGFNAIRVPNYLLGSWGQPHPEWNNYSTNKIIVDAYTSQGAVVIFSAHDLIGGYYEGNDWEVLKDFWRDMAQEFKDNPNVWFNLHNEPGNATANPQWVTYHRELIDIIRNEDAHNLIIVDGESWGQDKHTRTLKNSALKVMENNENILFSLHVYEQWNHDNADLDAYFNSLYNLGIPIIVGEYGSYNGGQNTLAASTKMMEAAQEREIGRVVWVSKANDNNDLTTGPGGDAEHFDTTNPEILTGLGQLVWDDLNRSEDLEQLSGSENPPASELTPEGSFWVMFLGIFGVMFLGILLYKRFSIIQTVFGTQEYCLTSRFLKPIQDFLTLLSLRRS